MRIEISLFLYTYETGRYIIYIYIDENKYYTSSRPDKAGRPTTIKNRLFTYKMYEEDYFDYLFIDFDFRF